MRVTVHGARDVDRRLFLGGLNAAFPGWGGDARFSWCFERALAGRPPDLLVARDGGEVVGGSAVTYRALALPDGARVVAGIMTGSWTLPAARGRGVFTRIVEESLALSPRLLAFVTAANASRGRLEAAGAVGVPTYYCRGATSMPEPPQSAVRFVYSADEWRSQFLGRPEPVEWIATDRWRAALERAGPVDRVLFVDGDRAAAVRSLADAGRRLFCFTIGAPASDDVTPGFLLHFGFGDVRWDVQNGDRM